MFKVLNFEAPQNSVSPHRNATEKLTQEKESNHDLSKSQHDMDSFYRAQKMQNLENFKARHPNGIEVQDFKCLTSEYLNGKKLEVPQTR